MKINHNLTKSVIEVSEKAKSTVEQKLFKEETAAEAVSQLPRMSLESVMPKGKIIRSVKKADLQKMIENFSDIKDTKTIETICKEWENDIQEMVVKFSKGNIPFRKLVKEHQKSLKELNKYQTFADKIYEMMTSGKSTPEEAMQVFEKYIEPVIMKTQEVLRKIDNLPKIKEAYSQSSIKQAAEYSSNETASVIETATKPKKTEPIKVQIKSVPEPVISSEIKQVKSADSTITDKLLKDIESVTDVKSASSIIFKLEQSKTKIPKDEYIKLSELIIDKMSKF